MNALYINSPDPRRFLQNFKNKSKFIVPHFLGLWFEILIFRQICGSTLYFYKDLHSAHSVIVLQTIPFSEEYISGTLLLIRNITDPSKEVLRWNMKLAEQNCYCLQ
jgi:hypothetical protein